MAFFKFRKGGEEPPAAPHQPESVEAMRRRARHRLIGAAVLVLAGVVGFPLLFDTQPRPIAVDIPIDIPDRNKAKPLPPPLAPVSAAPAAAPAAVSEVKTPAAQAPSGQAAIKTEAKSEAPVAVAAPARPESKPESKPEPRPAPATDEGAKARALLEGKGTEAAAAEGRFVVQIGAFSDAGKAREARLKVEKAGLKTYTHVAETKDGKRIRVRVGPFSNRTEADKAADRIKGLDLPAAILTL